MVQISEAPEEAIDSHLIAEQMCDIFAENEMDKKSITTVSAGSAAGTFPVWLFEFLFL